MKRARESDENCCRKRSPTEHDNQIFWMACRDGMLGVVRRTLKDIDVDSIEYEDGRAIHLAAKGGHVDIVNEVLENGADVNAVNELKATALHKAAYQAYVCAGNRKKFPDSRFDDPKKCRFFPVIFPLITRIPGIETKTPLFSRRKNLCG